MRKFFKWVVIHPKRIIILFLFITAVCLLLWQMVGVNYDIKDYLPEDSLSTVSLELMNSEFEGGIPNTRVMVKNVTVPEALGYKDRLLACEGVTDVTWLDDAVNIEIPLEMQDSDTVETFYRNGAALYSVTIDEDERIEAVDAIRAVIGDDNAMSGEAVSTAVATVSTVDELNIVVICAVIFTFIVLFISTPSWLEPLVVMIGIAVAVIINSGSNLIFGEISFVTNAAGNVLQLAVSLDYSVFLMHRFEECLQENPNPEEAMVDALSKSATSILSSGLTTVIGFIALIFMRFQIGPDVGLVLAKGVAISLITVFIFMPPLIISLHKPLQKLRHRSFLPSFLGIGRTVHRIMIPMVCVFVVMIVPGYLASNANNYYYGSSHFFNKETQFGSDIEQIEAIFGKNDTYVLMVL
jgi:predicted RND superfamily exporter protein